MEDMEIDMAHYRNKGDSNIMVLCPFHVLKELSTSLQKYQETAFRTS